MYEFLRLDKQEVIDQIYQSNADSVSIELQRNFFEPEQQKNVFAARLLTFAAAAAIALKLSFGSHSKENRIKEKIRACYLQYKAASQVPDAHRNLNSKFQKEIFPDYLSELARLIQEERGIDFFSAKKLLLDLEPVASFSLLKTEKVSQIIEMGNGKKIIFTEEPITKITKEQAEVLLQLSALETNQVYTSPKLKWLNKFSEEERIFFLNWINEHKTNIESQLAEAYQKNDETKKFELYEAAKLFLNATGNESKASKPPAGKDIKGTIAQHELLFKIYELEVKKNMEEITLQEIELLQESWKKLETGPSQKRFLKNLFSGLKTPLSYEKNKVKEHLIILWDCLKNVELEEKFIELKTPIPPSLNKKLPFLGNMREITTKIEYETTKIESVYYPHTAINSGSSRQVGKEYERHQDLAGKYNRLHLQIEKTFDDFFAPWLKKSSSSKVKVKKGFFEVTFFSPLFIDRWLSWAPYDNNLNLLKTNLKQSRKIDATYEEQQEFFISEEQEESPIQLQQSNHPINRSRELSPEKFSPKLDLEKLQKDYKEILTAAGFSCLSAKLNENSYNLDEIKSTLQDNQTNLGQVIAKDKIPTFIMGLLALVSRIQLDQPSPPKIIDNKNPALWKAALEILIIRGRGGVWTGGCKTSADRTAAVLSLTMAMETFYAEKNRLPDFHNAEDFKKTMEIQAKILVSGVFFHHPGLFCHFGAFGINQSDGLNILKTITKNPMYPEELHSAIGVALKSRAGDKSKPAATYDPQLNNPDLFANSQMRKIKLPLGERIQKYFANFVPIKIAEKMLARARSFLNRPKKPEPSILSVKASSTDAISKKLSETDDLTNKTKKYASGEPYYIFRHKIEKALKKMSQFIGEYIHFQSLDNQQCEDLENFVSKLDFFNIMDILAFFGIHARVEAFKVLVTLGRFNVNTLNINQIVLLMKLLPVSSHQHFSACEAYKKFNLTHLNNILDNAADSSYKIEFILSLNEKLNDPIFRGEDTKQHNKLLKHIDEAIHDAQTTQEDKLKSLHNDFVSNIENDKNIRHKTEVKPDQTDNPGSVYQISQNNGD